VHYELRIANCALYELVGKLVDFLNFRVIFILENGGEYGTGSGKKKR